MIQSIVSVQQFGGSSGNIDVDVENRSGGQAKNSKRSKDKKMDSRKRRRIPKFDNYTLLNNSIENINLATPGKEQYRKPASRESTEKEKRSNKFCRFHRTQGHNTNECKHLRDVIEELIWKKKSQQFVQVRRRARNF